MKRRCATTLRTYDWHNSPTKFCVVVNWNRESTTQSIVFLTWVCKSYLRWWTRRGAFESNEPGSNKDDLPAEIRGLWRSNRARSEKILGSIMIFWERANFAKKMHVTNISTQTPKLLIMTNHEVRKKGAKNQKWGGLKIKTLLLISFLKRGKEKTFMLRIKVSRSRSTAI